MKQTESCFVLPIQTHPAASPLWSLFSEDLQLSSISTTPQQLHDITLQRSDWAAWMLGCDWPRGAEGGGGEGGGGGGGIFQRNPLHLETGSRGIKFWLKETESGSVPQNPNKNRRFWILPDICSFKLTGSGTSCCGSDWIQPRSSETVENRTFP